MRVIKILIGIVALFCTVVTFAEDMPEYAKAGEWSIRVDTTLGYGCFLMAEFERGTVYRFGVDKSSDSIYLIIGDAKWKSIEYGKTYAIKIRYGDESPWSGDATGFSFDPPENQPYLWLALEDSNSMGLLIAEFMQEAFVAVDYNGREITRLSLKDSYKAGLALLDCQEAMDRIDEDPFNDATTSDDDPFKS